MRGSRTATAGLAVVTLVAGCSSDGDPSSSGVASEPAASAAPAFEGGSEITSAAHRFALPSEPAFELYDEYVREADGQHGRRWRWSPSGAAPYCYLHAVEQPGYGAQFPQSSIELFESGKDPEDTIVRNEVLDPPPAGAAAAVAQELTSTVTLDDGTPVALHGIIREQLTPGRTLVQFIASAPEDLMATCRIAEIADTLALTGAEAPATPDAPGAVSPPPAG